MQQDCMVVWLFSGILHVIPEEIYKFVFFTCEVLARKYTLDFSLIVKRLFFHCYMTFN